MPMYNSIEYSVNYLKTSGSLWQYPREVPNYNITESESFKCKMKITGKTPADGNTKNIKKAVPLEELSNLWRTFEMPLINWEINLILTWSEDSVIFSFFLETKFKITDKKTLCSCWNLLEQLKSGLKRIINWNKYQIKVSTEGQNQYLNFLIDPTFQRVNRLFVSLFEN